MDRPEEMTEEALTQLLHTQAERAVSPLLARYGDALYGVVLRMVGSAETAEDLMQEVFVKVWKNGGAYDPQKGKLFTWLLNIARNTAIDHLRLVKNQKRRQSISLDDLVYQPATHTKVPEVGLQHALAKLEPKYHQVIEMLYLRGYSQREAAEIMDIPLGTLKTRALSAVRQLRQLMQEHPYAWWGGIVLEVINHLLRDL